MAGRPDLSYCPACAGDRPASGPADMVVHTCGRDAD